MLESLHLAPAFFPRFMTLANGYFVSVRDFSLGQLNFRFDESGNLTGGDTLAIGETYYSYLVNDEPRLVSQQSAFTGSAWQMRTVLYEFDAQGIFADSLLLREEILSSGESTAGQAFHYDGNVLTCLAGSVHPSSSINDFRIWMTTYDGTEITHVAPWNPGPLPLHAYITSWGILRTLDARYVLSFFVRGDEEMELWFLGLEADGLSNSSIHIQDVESNHLLNGLTLFEHEGSLIYSFTEITWDGSFGGGAQVAAFPLGILLDANESRPELPTELALAAYPNPFNPNSTITFTMPASGVAEVTIFDVQGRKVETLIHETLHAGTHQTSWSANEAASGTYYCRLSTPDDSRVIPLILLK
ncbi:MAG: T9SS type A sorting domain-containing protein [Calditrichaeota bacterium]|nr:T9SS type A sorting domain-containing protein [Calditrichota bacterium]